MTYKQAKNKAYREYKKIGKIYCPYFKTKVAFNSHGFRHMIYKSQKNKRDKKSQQMRFKLFPKAVMLLKTTTTIQELDSYKSKLYIKRYGVRKRRVKLVRYYGFIAIISGWKIKVIVKKIGHGQPFFWSVIPNWVTSKKQDKGKRFINYTGNLEED